MVYSEKISKATCIFCGAPLTSQDSCNYCGCAYITQESYKKLVDNLPDLIILNVLAVNIETQIDYKHIHSWYTHNSSSYPVFRETTIHLSIDSKDQDLCRSWYESNKRKDVKIIFHNHEFVGIGCYIIGLRTTYDSKEVSQTNIEIVANKIEGVK